MFRLLLTDSGHYLLPTDDFSDKTAKHARAASLAWARAAFDVAFYATWLAIRVVWFPVVTGHLWCCAAPWPANQ